jgi:hypothetical protein
MLNPLLSRLNTLEKQRDTQSNRVRAMTVKLDADTDKASLLKEAILLAQKCLNEQIEFKEYLEKLDTSFLHALYNEDYRWALEPKEEEGAIVGLKPVTYQGEHLVKNIAASMKSIESFGVRLVFLLFTPELAPVMFLDEQMVHLDKDKWPIFLDLLRDIQKDIPVQFIFITHSPGDFLMTTTLTSNGNYTTARTE